MKKVKKKFKKVYKSLPKEADNIELFNILYWSQLPLLVKAKREGYKTNIKLASHKEKRSRYFSIQFTIGNSSWLVNDDGTISQAYGSLDLMDCFSLRNTLPAWLCPRLDWYAKNMPWSDIEDLKEELKEVSKVFKWAESEFIFNDKDYEKLQDAFQRLGKVFLRLWT